MLIEIIHASCRNDRFGIVYQHSYGQKQRILNQLIHLCLLCTGQHFIYIKNFNGEQRLNRVGQKKLRSKTYLKQRVFVQRRTVQIDYL